MTDHKRPADRGRDDSDYIRQKVPRLSDVLASLDMRVTNKLDDLTAGGVISQGELDAKALSELSQFEPQDALLILEQFASASLDTVRNKSAYLHGVIIRYRKDSGPRLERDVHSRLDKLYKTSKIKASDFDQRVYEALSELPAGVAIRVIDKFQAKVTDDVRNVSAFFTSMLRSEQLNPNTGHFGPGANHGGYRDPEYQEHQQRHQGHHRPPRQYDPFEETDRPEHSFGSQPAPPPRPQQHARQAAAPFPGSGTLQLPQQVLGSASGQGPTPQIVILSQEQLLQLQQPGSMTLQQLLPQLMASAQPAAAVQQQLMPPQPAIVLHGGAPQGAAFIQAPAAQGKRSYAVDHAQMGVRVSEFHTLSPFCEFVHPAPALKLQNLWDGGNRLVSLLDDRSWELLSQLGAPEALSALEEVVEAVQRQDLRNPNAFFMACAKRYTDKGKAQQAPGRQQYNDPSHRPGASTSQHGQRAAGREPRQGYAGPAGTSTGGNFWPREQTGSRQGQSECAFHLLPEALQELAQEAMERHHPVVNKETFDTGVVEYLTRLSPDDAMGVFEELLGADLSNVRNSSAYLMGMIRKRRQEVGGAPRVQQR